MLRNYRREHEAEEQGSHSTEENLLTIQDLRNIFVDDDSIEFDKIRQESNWGGEMLSLNISIVIVNDNCKDLFAQWNTLVLRQKLPLNFVLLISLIEYCNLYIIQKYKTNETLL